MNEVQQEVATASYSLLAIHWLKSGQKTRSWICGAGDSLLCGPPSVSVH